MNRRNTTTGRIRGTTPQIEAAARELRKTMTPAERVLWQALRRGQIGGLAFRRQHPVGPFVLDFFCPARKLAVELDGGVHLDRKDYDAARTKRLEAYGYQVLRFENEAVLNDLDTVLRRIAQAISPSPQGWGEGAGG